MEKIFRTCAIGALLGLSSLPVAVFAADKTPANPANSANPSNSANSSTATPLSQAFDRSKISQVQVYPGGATIERVAKVSAGAKEVKLICLPARFDLDSLQVQADRGITVGEISVQTLDRQRLPECANSALDLRIRDLEEQKALISAEARAQDYTLGYLKNFGSDRAGNSSAAGLAAIASTAEQLRKSAQDALVKQHHAQTKNELIDQQLNVLLAERKRLVEANPQVRTVQIRLSAKQDGELRLNYRISQAGWTPVYRAYLISDAAKTSTPDTSLNQKKAQIRLERHAQVAQTSGEDWSGVKLSLTTVQPNLSNRINPPSPWNLDVLRPQIAASQTAYAFAPAPLMAPQMRAEKAGRMVADAELQNFDVTVFQGEFAAQFNVPYEINLQSDGQKVSYALGNEKLDARIVSRVQPQQEAQAYLLAQFARPQGSWPAGNMQLFRDGDFIGQTQLRLGSDEKMELFFGRDEMVRVQVEPEKRDAANTGFIGNRAEQKISHAYLIENLHKSPVTLEVLEVAPVARHEDIRIQTQFMPKPLSEKWHQQDGIVIWESTLEAAKSQRFSASYVISYPKDANISGMR